MAKQTIEPGMPSTLHPIIEGFAPEETEWIPDWTDASKYDSHIDKAHWAWEFLRRNRYFQQHYDSLVKVNPDGSDLFETEWGILRKDYKSEYVASSISKSGVIRDGSPVWAITQPTELIDKTTVLGHSSGTKRHALVLEPGHVAMVFDLNSCLIHPDLLNAQIRYASDTLTRALSRHRVSTKTKKRTTPLSPNHSNSVLQTCLRVADAMCSDDPPGRDRIGEVLANEKRVLAKRDLTKVGPDEFSRAIQKHVEDAYRLIYCRGYLQFLI
jgi:hypothetical protein